MAKRKKSDPIAEPLRALLSASAKERAAALRTLHHLTIDMVDLRDVQSLVALLLADDPDLTVRSEAMAVTDYRASMGCDIGFAVPVLLRIERDETESEDLRARARQVLSYSETRAPVRRYFDA